MAVTGTCWAGPFMDMTEAYAVAAIEGSKYREERPQFQVELGEDGWYVYRRDGKYVDPRKYMRSWSLRRLIHCWFLYRTYQIAAGQKKVKIVPFGEFLQVYQKEHLVG